MPATDQRQSATGSASPHDGKLGTAKLGKAEVVRASRIPQLGARAPTQLKQLKPRYSKPLVSPRPVVTLGQSTTTRPAVEVQLPTSESSRESVSSSPDRSHLSLDDALGLATSDNHPSTSQLTLDPPHTVKRVMRSSLSVTSASKSTARRTSTARPSTPHPIHPAKTPRAATPARSAATTPHAALSRSARQRANLPSPARSPTETLLQPITIDSDDEDPLLLHGGEAMRGEGEGNPLLDLEYTEARRSVSVERSARRSGGGGSGRRGSKEPSVRAWGKRPALPSGLSGVLTSGRENSLEGEGEASGTEVIKLSDSDDEGDKSFAREDDTFAFANHPSLVQPNNSSAYPQLGDSTMPISDFAGRVFLDESTSSRGGGDQSWDHGRSPSGFEHDALHPLNDQHDFGGEDQGNMFDYPPLRDHDSSDAEPSDDNLDPTPQRELQGDFSPRPAPDLSQSHSRGRFRIEHINSEQELDLSSAASQSPAPDSQSPAPADVDHEDSDQDSIESDEEPTLLVRAAPTPKPESRHKKRRMTDEVPRRLTGDFVIPIEPPTSSPSRSPESERRMSPWLAQEVKEEVDDEDGMSMSLATSSPGGRVSSNGLDARAWEARDEEEAEDALNGLPEVTIEPAAEPEPAPELESTPDPGAELAAAAYELPFPLLSVSHSPSPHPSPTRLSSSVSRNSFQPLARSTSPAEQPFALSPVASTSTLAASIHSPLPRPRRSLALSASASALDHATVPFDAGTPRRAGPGGLRMMLSPLPQNSPRATMALGRRAGRTSLPAVAFAGSASLSGAVTVPERPMEHQARLAALKRRMRSMSPGVGEVEAMLTPRKRVVSVVEAVVEEAEGEAVERAESATGEAVRERSASAELVPKVESDVDPAVPVSTTPLVIDSPAQPETFDLPVARSASPIPPRSPGRSCSPAHSFEHAPVQLASPAHTSPELVEAEQAETQAEAAAAHEERSSSASVEDPMELDELGFDYSLAEKGPAEEVGERLVEAELQAEFDVEVVNEAGVKAELSFDAKSVTPALDHPSLERTASPEPEADRGVGLLSHDSDHLSESERHSVEVGQLEDRTEGEHAASESDATDELEDEEVDGETSSDEPVAAEDDSAEDQPAADPVTETAQEIETASPVLAGPELEAVQRSSPPSPALDAGSGGAGSESDATDEEVGEEDRSEREVYRYSEADTSRVPASVERLRASGNVSLGRAALQSLLFGEPAQAAAVGSAQALGPVVAAASRAEATPRASVVTRTGPRQRAPLTPKPTHPTLPVIEISSTSPRAAAKAAAILKVFGDYVEQGLQPPNTLLRAAGLQSSYRGEQRLRGLLRTAEKEIRRSTASPQPLAQPVFASAVEGADKTTPRRAVARAGLTPTPTSSKAAEPGSAGGRNDFPPTSPGEGSVASAQVDGHWGSADWRQLEKCLVKTARRARHEGQEMSGERVVERYLLEVGYEAGHEGEGDWAFDKLLTRVRALQARRLRGAASRASSAAASARGGPDLVKQMSAVKAEPASDEDSRRTLHEDAPTSDTADLPAAEDDTFFQRQPDRPRAAALVASSDDDDDNDDNDELERGRRERQPSVPLALAGARFAHLFEDEPMEKPPLPGWAQEELRRAREGEGRERTPEVQEGGREAGPVASARKLMSWVGGLVGRGRREEAPGPAVRQPAHREAEEEEEEQATSSEVEMLEVPQSRYRERSASSSLSQVIAVASYSSSSSSARSSSPAFYPNPNPDPDTTEHFPEPTYYHAPAPLRGGAALPYPLLRRGPPPPSPRAYPNLVQERIRELEEAESSREEESRVIEQLVSGVKRKASVDLARGGRGGGGGRV